MVVLIDTNVTLNHITDREDRFRDSLKLVMDLCSQGINIYYDNSEIEFDSLINPPRNREAGYPRVGRDVADPVARGKIVEVVNKWIEL